MAPKSRQEAILRETRLKAQNFHFCNTRGLSHMFELCTDRIKTRSTSTKNRFHMNQQSNCVWLNFLGTPDGQGAAQEPPRPPRTPNIAATWGQLGIQEGSKGFKMEWNIEINRDMLPKSAQDAPRPPSGPGLGDFGRFWEGIGKLLNSSFQRFCGRFFLEFWLGQNGMSSPQNFKKQAESSTPTVPDKM